MLGQVVHPLSKYTAKDRSRLHMLIRPMIRVSSDFGLNRLASEAHIASHQPNPKMVEIGARKLGLPFERFIMPGKTMGNMGPASVLIALSMLKKQGSLTAGNRILA